MHRDGEVAKSPIALCEVQGYVYEAKYRMASLLRSFGDTAAADKCKKDAAEMAKRFENPMSELNACHHCGLSEPSSETCPVCGRSGAANPH